MDMNFIFSWSTRYLTRSLRSLVRHRVDHSKIKFISTRGHVISSISLTCGNFLTTQPLRHYNCKFRGALLIERLPLLVLCHKVNICMPLSSVPFHRRGFDGSSRIQLHLVCFFPHWKMIVNFSVSHRNGASICIVSDFAFRHLRVFKNVPD